MKNYETIVLTAPGTEPVSLAEAKDQLRLEDIFTLDDDYINALISVARDRAENYCNRFFTEQTVKLVHDGAFPLGDVVLPYPDLQSVDEVSYTDEDGSNNIIDTADYSFDSDTRKLRPSVSWPTGAVDCKISVTTGAPVEFNGVKQAILMIVTDMYELRTETVVAASLAENMAVNTLLTQYRWNMGI
jgi:uncharacterized phiE125 gp8 family phage protein